MKVKLKDVCTFYSGTGFPTQYQGKEEGQYPFYKVSDIANNATSGKIYLESCNNYINDDVLGKIKGCVVPRNTVVFAKIGEALKLNRRAITSCDCLIDNNAMGIAPQADFLRIQYFYLFMKNLKMQLLAESTTVPSVRKTKLENYELILPSLINQEEIENKIFAVLNIIEKRRQELKLLDNLIKARFVELFGDLKTNSKGWQIVGFKECADIDTNMIHDFEGYEDYPHIGIDSIEKETGNLVGYRTVAEDGIISGKYLFTPAHIIYSKIRPNLNKVAMPEFTGLCSADAYPILVKEGVCNREYFGYTLRSNYFLDYILAFSNRTNLPKVNKNQVEGFTLPLPPIDLQNQFAAFVQRIDKSKLLSLIKLLEQLITYLYNVFIIYRQDKGEEVEDHE